VKPEKQAEFKSLVQRFLKYKKENPTLFKEMKSWRLFTQTFGSISGAYVEQLEFDSFAEYEKCHKKLLKDRVLKNRTRGNDPYRYYYILDECMETGHVLKGKSKQLTLTLLCP